MSETDTTNIGTEEPVPSKRSLEEQAATGNKAAADALAAINAVNPPKPDTEAKTTTYIVLKAGPPDVGTWALDSELDAANAEAAIRLACKTIDNPAGTYVAIPARSWKPIVVKTEVQTLLKLEEAK